MQQPLEITFRGMEPSGFIERRIRSKMAELERYYQGIISCRATVEPGHQRRRKGNLYSVRLDILVPDKEIVAGRERRFDHSHEDVYVAIRDTFNAAARQLEDYARRRRRRERRQEVPDQGRVLRIYPAEGYGFLELADGTEVYFHQNSVAHGAFGTLDVGDNVRVMVTPGEGEMGPQAHAVIPPM